MAKDTNIKISDVKAYVQQQLLAQQIEWRDRMERGAEGDRLLAAAAEAVMDKLYEFANIFWDAEIPAPGQGYSPPEEIYAQIKKDRQLDAIDEQVATLLRQRQAVIDGSGGQPPVAKSVAAGASLATRGRVTAQADGSAPSPSGSGGTPAMEPRDES